jgi:hypothetical protein
VWTGSAVLLSKCKALSSNPEFKKIRKKEEKSKFCIHDKGIYSTTTISDIVKKYPENHKKLLDPRRAMNKLLLLGNLSSHM